MGHRANKQGIILILSLLTGGIIFLTTVQDISAIPDKGGYGGNSEVVRKMTSTSSSLSRSHVKNVKTVHRQQTGKVSSYGQIKKKDPDKIILSLQKQIKSTASDTLQGDGNSEKANRSKNQKLQTDSLSQEEMNRAFKKAFEKVIEQQQKNKQSEQHAEQQRASINEKGLLIGGMVLDETQTRMGRNFYNIFYKQWEPPTEATNYMLTVSEKMTPSLGTIVTIKINDATVFRTRLQPRYDYIEQISNRAVAICQHRLQRMRVQTENLQAY